jgi:hypothetical protein
MNTKHHFIYIGRLIEEYFNESEEQLLQLYENLSLEIQSVGGK